MYPAVHRIPTYTNFSALLIVQERQVCFRFFISCPPVVDHLCSFSRYDWLALPHNVAACPNEAVVRHPHREHWHQIGRQFKQRFYYQQGDREYDPDAEHYSRAPHGTCRVQVVRSVCDWSQGVLTEHSIQNACEGKISSLLRAWIDDVLQIYS